MARFLSIVGFVAALLFASGAQAGDTYVHGYTRSDGTYVQPHYRSAPDGNPYNNYSTRGNVNPYTGQPGTKDPYSSSGSGSGYGGSTYSNPYGNTYSNPYDDNN